jgi:hypothetical protein
MVAASQVYHSKVAHAIRAMAMFEAKKAVKRQLQAEGKKISWYLHKDITIMASALLEERWDEFIAKAKVSAVVRDLAAEIEAKERRKAQRRTGHFLSQSVDTSPPSAGVSQ